MVYWEGGEANDTHQHQGKILIIVLQTKERTLIEAYPNPQLRSRLTLVYLDNLGASRCSPFPVKIMKLCISPLLLLGALVVFTSYQENNYIQQSLHLGTNLP